ncbi:MAG: hypothetical protein HY678_05665 [Chloroflexi bacterium]|nr:hypothetical protein [Chloroflexota bacterium]
MVVLPLTRLLRRGLHPAKCDIGPSSAVPPLAHDQGTPIIVILCPFHHVVEKIEVPREYDATTINLSGYRSFAGTSRAARCPTGSWSTSM